MKTNKFNINDYVYSVFRKEYGHIVDILESGNYIVRNLFGNTYITYADDIQNTYEDKNSIKPNAVNRPPHYCQFSIEAWDMMISIYGKEKVAIYAEINAFKYAIRAGFKDDLLQDIGKRDWYLNKVKELKNGKL